MPELPEVEITRRGIEPHLKGRTITGVEVRESRLRWAIPPEVEALAGCKIVSVKRRGKYILVDCGRGSLMSDGSCRGCGSRRLSSGLWLSSRTMFSSDWLRWSRPCLS